VVDWHAVLLQSTLARRNPADHIGAEGPHLRGVKAALLAGHALHDDAAGTVDEDAHDAASRVSATMVRAASVAVAAGTIPAASRMRRPSSSLVPVMRTTSGLVMRSSSRAATTPRATSSPRVMPPKMLMNTPRTLGSSSTISSALRTLSAPATSVPCGVSTNGLISHVSASCDTAHE